MKTPILPCLITTLALAGPTSVCAQTQPQNENPPTKQATNSTKQPDTKESAHPRPRVVTDLSGFDLLDPGKSKKQTMVAGATRGMPRAMPLAPALARLYGSNPQFQWRYPGKVQKFVFVLMDDRHAELLRTDVSGAEFRYPATAPPFIPGKTYSWTVGPANFLPEGISSPAGFVAIPIAQRQEVEQHLSSINSSDPYDAACQRAQVFTDERLWYDAIGAYTDLIAKYPDRAELYKWRGTIYAQLVTTQALADDDFARAEELEAKQ